MSSDTQASLLQNDTARDLPDTRTATVRFHSTQFSEEASMGTMRLSSSVRIITAVVSIFLQVAAVDARGASSLPKIRILATGGTIAGAQAQGQDAGYKAGSFKVDDLINAVPKLKDLAVITGEQVVEIGSQDMNNEVWLKLAKRLNTLLVQADVDGVVVTHGTDTMEETSYFLNLVVKSDKPVVMVGSMRPATAIGADGPANLYNGVAVAAHPGAKGRGVLVLLNDEIHYAREITKTNSTQLDTFKSPNRGKAGMTNAGRVYWYDPLAAKYTSRSEFLVESMDQLPRVEIFYAHANMGRDFIDHAVKLGVKGIVIAGVGDGNMTQVAVDGLQEAVKRGVAVVRSSRTGSGITDRNVELNDDRLGFIASIELNAQKARVLLMLGLTKTSDRDALQKLFYTY
jgi:L-asparaginase